MLESLASTVSSMSKVRRAALEDLDALVQLESHLFAEDAGVYEEFADPTWPEREGADDFRRLIGSGDCIVLAAERDETMVGLLVGYTTASSPTRLPVTYAVLRSLYVLIGHRRCGVAVALIDEFVRWATEKGCVEIHVDSYAANVGAQALYERNGFSIQSVSRARRL